METGVTYIIQNSAHLSEYDKDVFCAVFEQLQKDQEKLYRDISKTVNQQLFPNSQIDQEWNISVLCIDKKEVEEAKKNGFYEMIAIDSLKEQIWFEDLNAMETENGINYTAGVGFLNCDYHEIVESMNHTYTAHVRTNQDEYEISYTLKPYRGFYEKEKIVEKTAHQYHITRPALFSPITRRAVVVQLDFGEHQVSKSDDAKIDLQLEQNQLLHILQMEKTIVWNVEIEEKNEIPRPQENVNKVATQLFSDVFQIYQFLVDQNEFIFVESDGCDVKRYENIVYLNISETQNIDTCQYVKVRILDTTKEYLEKQNCIFRNYFDRDRIYKERIRTQADIDYVLNAFRHENVQYLGMQRKAKPNEMVQRYEHGDAYWYPKSGQLRSSSVCYLKFKKQEDNFFEDHVNYIVSYMNYYYPEFYWVGVSE